LPAIAEPARFSAANTSHESTGASQIDNGLELIAKIVQQWLKANAVKTIYIEPGSPWQNGFVESFHGRFRDECLNREQLWTLTEAGVVVGNYRQEYNQVRPHSRLSHESPAMFAARSCPSRAPVGMDKEQTKT
jgi:transposase InsO family protein